MNETLVALAIFFTTMFVSSQNSNICTQNGNDKPQCEVVK